MVCSDVEIESVLQDISGEHLNRGSNKTQDARLDIHARGFWERHRSAFFDVRVCHPNAASYRDLEPQQIYRIRENEKKRLYSRRVLDIELGTFTPLVFTATGGMGKECLMYHSRLAQLITIKKEEQYAKTNSWVRTRTSFALLRSALVCLRGSRTRWVPCDINNVDIDVAIVEGAIQSDYWCVSLLLNGKYSSITHWERYLISLSFLVIFLLRTQSTLKIVCFWFLKIEMDCFNWNEMFLIRIAFFSIKWIFSNQN